MYRVYIYLYYIYIYLFICIHRKLQAKPNMSLMFGHGIVSKPRFEEEVKSAPRPCNLDFSSSLWVFSKPRPPRPSEPRLYEQRGQTVPTRVWPTLDEVKNSMCILWCIASQSMAEKQVYSNSIRVGISCHPNNLKNMEQHHKTI